MMSQNNKSMLPLESLVAILPQLQERDAACRRSKAVTLDRHIPLM